MGEYKQTLQIKCLFQKETCMHLVSSAGRLRDVVSSKAEPGVDVGRHWQEDRKTWLG